MTKTLHLVRMVFGDGRQLCKPQLPSLCCLSPDLQYEAHFISMIEEATANKSNLLATAVLEPYMGEEGQSVPGSLVGGHNFSLSCACLCTVLQAKPYHGGYLVRLRGEARMGLSSLEQVEPYMRCAIYPMPDEPVQLHEMDTLRTKLAVLEDIMRDIQNLVSKFRCDETAQIQQAMRWVNLPAIFPSVLSIEGQAAMPDSIATPSTSGTREEDEEENIVDIAARLSLASLQWLPHSGQLVSLLPFAWQGLLCSLSKPRLLS